MKNKILEMQREISESENQESPVLKMPDNRRLGKIRSAWEKFGPKKAYEYLWLNSSPLTYVLWKLPKDAHKKVNRVLNYATSLLARTQPELALATGIVDGVSQTLYGLKNIGENSGRHVVSGLTKIVQSTEKIDPNFSAKAKKFLEDYFINFREKEVA